MNLCKKCGQCCKNHPCAPLPSEIADIASYLHISDTEFIEKYTIWDFYINEANGEYDYYLSIKRTRDTDRLAPYMWAFSNDPCIFLTPENLCAIHPVKPAQAKNIYCTIKDDTPLLGKQELAEIWKQAPYFKAYFKK